MHVQEIVNLIFEEKKTEIVKKSGSLKLADKYNANA